MRWAIPLVLAAIAGQASAASSTWIRISSPSVEIFTDSGERPARAVLDRFETLNRVFRESYRTDSSAPLRVYIFSSARDYEQYRPNPQANAFYENDGDGDFIVLPEADALERISSHEYLHMVINHASAMLPHWLEEGVPDLYSTLSVNASTMRVGDPIEPYLRLLASGHWLSAEDLASGRPTDSVIFYAESWALVHMLSLDPRWSKGMPQFVKFLEQGRDQNEAFAASFGMSMNDALVDLRAYSPSRREMTLPAPPVEKWTASLVTRLAPVDATLMLAGLALHTDHRELARSLFLRAAKENPQSPAAVAGLGALALAENRKEDARREFERAIAMGSRDADTAFQLAALANDNALLEKTLAIDPNFAEAHFLLGVRATDDGNFPTAIEHLRRAVTLFPRRFSYWNALGYAQAKSGDRQGAAESARRAAILASSNQEEQMAASLTLLAATIPAVTQTTRESKPDVVTPESWQNRKGDARVEGTLTRVDCESVPPRLFVSTETAPGSPGKTVELNVPNPAAVELLNAEGVSTTLGCGEQSRPIAMEYLAATGEVTRIEFKHAVIIKR